MSLNKKVKTFIPAKRHQPGMFGVEIEVDADCAGVILPEGWKAVHDGSLKKINSMEFVFNKPENLPEAKKLVKNLYKNLGGIAGDSMLAGVHVHVNCQELTLKQLATFVYAAYSLEPAIIEQFGPNRKGNLFCLGLEDAENPVEVFKNALEEGNLNRLDTDSIRSAATNLTAIPRYGSVEFRAMMTPKTAEPILDWLDVLATLRETAPAMFETPRELVYGFSAAGIPQTLTRLVGAKGTEWLMKSPDYESRIYQGLRNVQFEIMTMEWN